jgi:hypothetical protein
MALSEFELSTSKLFWAQWLSTGLSLCCLLVGLGDFSLRYPLPIVLWLLGSGVLAIGRLVAQQVGPVERPWLKTCLWSVVLASPGLLWWAATANYDITFRDAQTTIRQHRTISIDYDEEEIETRRYQAIDALFEVPMGSVERRPVQPGEAIGY